MKTESLQQNVTTGTLEVENLNVVLGESHILHGVSFHVPAGGITALLGRNGAGKTTTLKAILGLVPRTGTVRYDGEDVTRARTHEIVQRGIGYVPEDREVFASLTVAENLRLAARHDLPERRALIDDLFPRLRERSGQLAGTMSGGEQQMLALARAMLNDNRLLFVDEPSQGLAPHLVTEVANALERMSELATTVIVEQNLGVVRRIARDAVVIDQGRVVYSGPLATLLDDADLTRELLGVSGGGRNGRNDRDARSPGQGGNPR